MKTAGVQGGGGGSGNAWPSAGFVDGQGAAAMFGVSGDTRKQWTIGGNAERGGA